ncbi:MAG TPA: hypothetical protein VGB96_03660 [Archangium sp.]
MAGRAAAAEPSCQELSDQYAIVAGQGFGFAPADVQTLWKQKNCTTRPQATLVSALCQEMSDRFDIVAGTSFGSANADAQGSWKALACTTKPRSCQELSDQYAMVAGQGLGFAPAYVKTVVWGKKSCATKPQAPRVTPLCQEMSDRYGIVAGGTFGTADADVQGSWKALACTTRPAGK